MKKKLLICGATGFIGRNLVEYYSKISNYEVYATYHLRPSFTVDNVQFVSADLTSALDVNRICKGMDVIIQAAATTSGAKDIISKPYIHVTDNSVMNSLIFRAAHDHQIGQVVFFSCTIMYQSSDRPISEDDLDLNVDPNKNYFGAAWTKIYLEKMCEFYSRIGSTKYSVIRHSNIYGPHDKYDLEKSHVFGATVTKVMTNQSGTIEVWGDGSEQRDLLHVSDLISYVDLVLTQQKEKYLMHNVGLGTAISVSDLVRKVIEISGKNIKIEFNTSKPSLKTKLCLDITRAREFGWKPKLSLEQGIQQVLEWYRKTFPTNVVAENPSSTDLDRVEKQLFQRYGKEAFMYVEYPHKRFWRKESGDERFKTQLIERLKSGAGQGQLLYVHMPYCHSQCFYCTCHVEISIDYKKVIAYLDYLYKEIDLLKDLLSSNGIKLNVKEIHLGGGSPTYLQEPEFDRMVEKLATLADFDSLSEFAIEIDPRRIKPERMRYYHSKGINRISFGIQDFDPEVQRAVNRVQPAFLTEKLITPELRSLFKNGVNFDVICGLPKQTRESFRKTMEKVIEMSPDRICLNYMHFSPTFSKHQLLMPVGEIPSIYEKKQLFVDGLEMLISAGYLRMGYDHFAKVGDAISLAMENSEMGWNRLGVVPGRYSDTLGIGTSSTSTIGSDYYAQNCFDLLEYQNHLNSGRLPVSVDYKLNQDDMLRRHVIEQLRSYFSVDFKEVESEFGINFSAYFGTEISELQEFIRNGVLVLTLDGISITEMGQQFANLVCSIFDNHLNKKQSAQNQAIVRSEASV